MRPLGRVNSHNLMLKLLEHKENTVRMLLLFIVLLSAPLAVGQTALWVTYDNGETVSVPDGKQVVFIPDAGDLDCNLFCAAKVIKPKTGKRGGECRKSGELGFGPDGRPICPD